MQVLAPTIAAPAGARLLLTGCARMEKRARLCND
jgi:hypothetical protein